MRAFEANAIDYLLEPVEPARLRATVNRAVERLEQSDVRGAERERLEVAAADYAAAAPPGPPLR